MAINKPLINAGITKGTLFSVVMKEAKFEWLPSKKMINENKIKIELLGKSTFDPMRLKISLLNRIKKIVSNMYDKQYTFIQKAKSVLSLDIFFLILKLANLGWKTLKNTDENIEITAKS